MPRKKMVEIDRRQRLVAALMMMGFDLPQPMDEASNSMLEAARICPGLTVAEIPNMNSQSRIDALRAAHKLINEMIAEELSK